VERKKLTAVDRLPRFENGRRPEEVQTALGCFLVDAI
jgi:hypothetical protein